MTIYDKSVYLPSELLRTLGEHTGHFWASPLLEPIICDAIRAWMAPAPAVRQPADSPEAGYQWKQLFLPAGTRLRACFGGQPYFAVVAGTDITFEGQSISPSGFANLRGSGNRNAWKAIWLRLPGSDAWLLADVCRSARKSAITRMFGGDAPAARPGLRAAARVRQDEGKGTQTAPRRPRAGGTADIERAAVPRQPAARRSGPRQTAVRPSGAPESAHRIGVA